MPGHLPQLRGVDRFVTFDAFGGQGMYYGTPLIVDGERQAASGSYIAADLTDRALDFLRDPSHRPFALFLSHKSVHSPFQPAPEEAGRYADAPVSLPDEVHSWVGYVDAQYVHMNPFSLEEEIRLYGEAVTSMDREIGRVLGALDEDGLADDTVVIYTSDNGYLWGEHRLIDKRWPYEESIRVPLIVRDPRSPTAGGSVGALVSNLDVAPTLVDAAGIEVPQHMRGRSLRPLLDGTASKLREEIYYSYYFEPPFPVPTVHALRTSRHKYVEYEGRPPELYDLVDDPNESRNLVGSEEGDRLVPEFRARLHRARREAEAR
jgi:arylsulfatase A-like enzyme